MWFLSVSLMTAWMLCVVIGFTPFGLTHLLCAAAIAIELFRRTGRRPLSPING